MSVSTKNTEIHATTPDVPKEQSSPSPDQTNDPHAKDYAVYDYLMSHPSSALGAASVLVAIFTFFAQASAYINNKNTLAYWGFSSSYASLGSDSVLYSAIAAILYTIILTIVTMWYVNACKVFNEQTRLLLTFKHVLREETNIKRSSHTAPKDISSTDISEPQTQNSDRHVTSQKIAEHLQFINQKLFRNTTKFIASLFPIVFGLAIISVIMPWFNELSTSFWTSTALYLVFHIIMFILIYVFGATSSLSKKKIRASATNLKLSALLEQIDSLKTHPLKKTSSKNVRIKNSSFTSVLMSVIVTNILLIGFYGVSISQHEAYKTTFEIATISGGTYAVVYHNNDTFFLEKADISGDEITIYTHQQRIINFSDVSLDIYSFQKVTKVEGYPGSHQSAAPSSISNNAFS